MYDLESPGALKALSTKLKTDIDNWCAEHFDDGPRTHLGASEIGNSCAKYLWLKFRWCFHKKHDGRQQRLFQRGHFEEPRFVQYLAGIGFDVQCFDEANINETDKGKRQIRISDCKGHFGGSLDGIASHIEYGTFLTEFKTNGTGKGFDKLVAEGVKLAKPVHYAQMCVYGYKKQLKYAIYMCVNKNDDSLYVEVVELDWLKGKELIENKANMIIFSDTAPNGVGVNPAYYECSSCDCKDECHNGKEILINCRSCKNASPVDNAEWFCCQWNNIIPKEFIPKACSEWKGIYI